MQRWEIVGVGGAQHDLEFYYQQLMKKRLCCGVRNQAALDIKLFHKT